MEDLMEEQKALAISVRGASHLKTNKPVQDYSLSVKCDDYAIAVVCDGHGADKHFRSEVGSKLAANVAAKQLRNFYRKNNSWNKMQGDLIQKLERIKLAIILDWQNEIDEFSKQNPFSEEELKKASPAFLSRKEYDVCQPYGTTLLGALVCKDYYLVLMIGDGAIHKISGNFESEIIEFPGKNEYNDAPHSATDSLCEIDAYNKIFFSYGQIKENEPIALSLCSDGLTESQFFRTEVELQKKIINYLNYYAEEGIEKATSAIESQLTQITNGAFPYDDISLAFATLCIEKFDKRNSQPNSANQLINSSNSPECEEKIESNCDIPVATVSEQTTKVE